MIKKIIVSVVLLGTIFMVLFIAYAISISSKEYTENKQKLMIEENLNNVYVYDINGKLIDYLYGQKKSYIKLDEIPMSVQNAFIAIEDQEFYKHKGFNLIRILKSLFINIVSRRVKQGGSTITQQLVKNTLLTREKTVWRKVKEIIIATMIERDFRKEEILEKYLNEIYFGTGINGVKEAARIYLNKPLKNINISEAAFLAAIPNNPTKYSPFSNFENTIDRRDLIIKTMYKEKLITEEEKKKALKYKIDVKAKNKEIFSYPDIDVYVKKELKEINEDYLERKETLKIYTTFDINYQKLLKETIDESTFLTNNPECEVSAVVIDTQSGYLKAIIGGRDYKYDNFHRAYMAERQIGSTIKPLLYLMGIEEYGLEADSIVNDSPVKVTWGKKGEKAWSPKNAYKGYLGEISVNQALEESSNTVPVKLLKEYGVNSFNSFINKVYTDVEVKDYPFILGTYEMSPLKLSEMYIPLSNGGYRITPAAISLIVNGKKKRYYELDEKKERVFNKYNVAILTQSLINATTFGTGRKAYCGLEQAGKTGTTTNGNDAWYCGYTGDLLVVVYMGYDKGRSVKRTGGDICAPLFKAYMEKLIDSGVYSPMIFQNIEDGLSNNVLAEVRVQYPDNSERIVLKHTKAIEREAQKRREREEKEGFSLQSIFDFFK